MTTPTQDINSAMKSTIVEMMITMALEERPDIKAKADAISEQIDAIEGIDDVAGKTALLLRSLRHSTLRPEELILPIESESAQTPAQ